MPPVPLQVEALLTDDPDAALAWADMDAWADARPCVCTDEDGLHREDCPQR